MIAPLLHHNWNVPRTHENAMSAPMTAAEYPISETRHIVVTNTWFGMRVDTWTVWDRASEGVADVKSAHYAYVDNSLSQSDALNRAREYAWFVYRKDIANMADPF